MRKSTFLLLLLVLLVSAFAPPGVHSKTSSPAPTAHFDQQLEFPNLFLPEEFRHLPPEKLPPELVTRLHTKLDEAIASIFKRMTIPISSVKDGVVVTKTVKIMPHLEKALKGIDAGVRIMPSSGVVRSTLGYIYHQMHEARSLKSPESVLQSIIDATDDIPGHEIRGVGSDFDILITGHDPKKFKDLQKTTLKITNSSADAYKIKSDATGFKKALFTIGDVNDYQEQLARSTGQGGSTLDFLAFDVASGKTIEPERMGGIIDDFIRGRFSYALATSPEAAKTVGQTTVRGIRPLLELPFLQLKDETAFQKALENLLATLKETDVLLPEHAHLEKALEQFDKMVRNARFEGAHNRLYRAKPGSLDDLILRVSQEFKRISGKATIPKFVDRSPLSSRLPGKKELNGLPQDLLTSAEDFMKSHVPDGILHYGTPSMNNGMAVMRGGILTGPEGPGIRLSSELQEAVQNSSGPSGVVFELRPKKDNRVNILVWNEKTQADPFITSLLEKTNGDLDETFSILARDHGIDVIVNNKHILLQNIDAVELPKGIEGMVKAYGTTIDNPLADPLKRASVFNSYENLRNYAAAHEGMTVPPLQTGREQLMRDFLPLLSQDPPAQKISALEAIKTLGPPPPAIQLRVTDLLADPDAKVRNEALLVLEGSTEKDPQVLKKMGSMLERQGPKVKASVLEALTKTQFNSPELEAKLLALLSNPEQGVRDLAGSALNAQARLSPEAHAALFRLLDNPDSQTVSSALTVFEKQDMNSPALKSKLLELTHHQSSQVKGKAVSVLAKVDGANPASQFKIVEILKDPDVREEAGKALKSLRPTDPGVQAKLVALFDHPVPAVRLEAVRIVGASKTATQAAQLRLVEFLLDDPAFSLHGISNQAVMALGSIGPNSPEVLARLEEVATKLGEGQKKVISQLTEGIKKRIAARVPDANPTHHLKIPSTGPAPANCNTLNALSTLFGAP